MIYKTTCAIIFRGNRVEKGSLIETTPEDAARLGNDLEDVVDEARVLDAEVVEPVAVEAMTHAQLKKRAEELGLKVKGSVADLVERINLALEEKPEGEVKD